MRLYRTLLRLYPASFRHEYGGDMAAIFERRRREAGGPLAVLVLWLGAVADTVASAAAVHADILRQDLRYTARSLGRSKGFAVTAIAVVGLGIGATTAVFSVTDFVLIRPLPFPRADRLVRVWERHPGYPQMELSPANYRDFKKAADVFSSFAAYTDPSSANLTGSGEPRRLVGAEVTNDFLPTLGIQPLIGRPFTPADDRPGAPGTILLSYRLWQTEFGGAPDILGRTLSLDQQAYTVIGVMPATFHYPEDETEYWTAMRAPAGWFEDRNNNFWDGIARLKDGVTSEQARSEMDVVAAQLRKQYPKENAHTGAWVNTLRDELPWQSKLLLRALAAAALCILLIACANLANLLLTRALARRQELAIRAAMGAGRERLVRQLLTESLVLAFAGGAVGVLIGAVSVPLLMQLVPATLPLASAPHVDLRVLAFAAALTLANGVGFAVLPVLRASRRDDLDGLRDTARAGGGGKERLRAGLVVAEIVASIVLLVSAGLLLRALWRVQAIDPGFRVEGTLTVRTPLPSPRYDDPAKRRGFYTTVLDEVRALPGVAGAAVHQLRADDVRRRHLPGVHRRTHAGGSIRRLLREPARGVAGILHDARRPDPAGTRPRGLGRGRSPARRRGQRIVREAVPGGRDEPDRPALRLRVPGVHRGRRGRRPARARPGAAERAAGVPVVPPAAAVALLLAAGFDRPRIGRAGRPAAVDSRHRAQGGSRSADPDVRTMAEIVADKTASRAAQLRVLGAFAVVALLLAAIGIHGVLSFAVSQRTQEIGVRIALGAQRRDILGWVLGRGAVLAVAGVVPGIALAYVAGRLLEALLAGVTPGDATTFLTAVALAVVMTLAGSLVPTLRAIRVDPIRAIRQD